mmetsp:Transcript_15261/g.47628  ORF Transcript_15261/g.47628 Transcript_15261/m.47628 type:complete len:306 (-) Transcript_15261:1385-2302(-)
MWSMVRPGDEVGAGAAAGAAAAAAAAEGSVPVVTTPSLSMPPFSVIASVAAMATAANQASRSSVERARKMCSEMAKGKDRRTSSVTGAAAAEPALMPRADRHAPTASSSDARRPTVSVDRGIAYLTLTERRPLALVHSRWSVKRKHRRSLPPSPATPSVPSVMRRRHGCKKWPRVVEGDVWPGSDSDMDGDGVALPDRPRTGGFAPVVDRNLANREPADETGGVVGGVADGEAVRAGGSARGNVDSCRGAQPTSVSRRSFMRSCARRASLTNVAISTTSANTSPSASASGCSAGVCRAMSCRSMR